MTAAAMASIEGLRIASLETLHSGAEVRLWGLEKKMNVVVHQAVGETSPPLSDDDLFEHPQINPSVDLVAIHELASVTAGIDVVHTALQVLPRFAGHTCVSPAAHPPPSSSDSPI
jgi:hypothetical protein